MPRPAPTTLLPAPRQAAPSAWPGLWPLPFLSSLQGLSRAKAGCTLPGGGGFPEEGGVLVSATHTSGLVTLTIWGCSPDPHGPSVLADPASSVLSTEIRGKRYWVGHCWEGSRGAAGSWHTPMCSRMHGQPAATRSLAGRKPRIFQGWSPLCWPEQGGPGPAASHPMGTRLLAC